MRPGRLLRSLLVLICGCGLGGVLLSGQTPPPLSPNLALDPRQQTAYRSLLSTLDQLIMAGKPEGLVYSTYSVVRKAISDGKLLFIVDSKSTNRSLIKSVYFSPNTTGASYIVADPVLLDLQVRNPELALSLVVNAMVFAETFFSKGQEFLRNYSDPVESFLYSMDALYVQTVFLRDYLLPKNRAVGDYGQFLVNSLAYDKLTGAAMFVIGVDQDIVYGISDMDSALADGTLKAPEYVARLLTLLDTLLANSADVAELDKTAMGGTADDKEVRERSRYIATVSGLTMLRYGVGIINRQLSQYMNDQRASAQTGLEAFNKKLAALAEAIEPWVASVGSYRTQFLERMGM